MRYILILLMLLPGVVMGADNLGRLFTTPAERASLDYLRQTSKVQAIDPEQIDKAETGPVMPSSISVQGYVKRSDGKKGTVWVNRIPIQENSGTDEVQVGKLQRDGNQVQLKLTANGKQLQLKAGQIYDLETGRIKEISAYAYPAPAEKVEQAGSIGTQPDAVSGTSRR